MKHVNKKTTLLPLMTLAVLLLAACEARGPAAPAAPTRQAGRLVPEHAELVASGRPPISFFMTGGGMLYVVDVDGDSLIHSGNYPIDAAAIVAIDPERRQVVLRTDDEVAYPVVEGIDPEHRYQIWLVPLHRQLQERQPVVP